MTNPIRFSGAVHEAGHAVVGHALKASIGAMHVHDDGSGGTETADHHLGLRDRLAICVAGMAAQDLLACKRGQLTGSSDYGMASKFIEQSGIKGDHWPHITAARTRAHRILKTQLDKLRAIAAELDTHGQLDAQRVAALLA